MDLALAVEWMTSSFPSLTASGTLVVCPSGLHVLCGSRGGLHPGPSGASVSDTVGIWLTESILMGPFLVLSQAFSWWVLDSAKAAFWF